MDTATSALALGFSDPVGEAQEAFRAAMDALARPGTPQPLSTRLVPPAPLTPELAALALALADHEAPLWLDTGLSAEPGVAAFLRFHTGARIVTDPAEAAFALVADLAALPPFETFALGSEDYPDRSTTILAALRTLSGEGGLTLEGPGIRGTARLAIDPCPEDLVERLAANRALFPRGIDLILAAPGLVAGLPRSTLVTGGV